MYQIAALPPDVRKVSDLPVRGLSSTGAMPWVHSLRKTAITNALQHGAPIEKVQQLAGHCDIRTTQLYYKPSAKDSEDAARHIQIR